MRKFRLRKAVSSLCTRWHSPCAQRLVVTVFMIHVSLPPKYGPETGACHFNFACDTHHELRPWWVQQIHYNRPCVSNLLCLFPRHMSVHLFFSSIIGDVSRLWRGSSLCWNMTRTCQSSNIFRAVKESRSNCHGTKLMGGKETQNPEFICFNCLTRATVATHSFLVHQ